MANTNYKTPKKHILLEEGYIEKLAKFGSEDDESLEMIMETNKALDIIEKNFINKTTDKPTSGILGLWKKILRK